MTRELPRRWRRWAAHHRVHATMLFAVAYVAFSAPDSDRLLVGGAMVLAGQLLRLWAAGHIRRNVTLACTGPYRIVRHPLYVGSLLMGTGLALAVENTYWWLLTFVGLYVAFYWPAMHVEELRLQSLFGAEYQEYMVEVPRLLPRFFAPPRWLDAPACGSFSWRRVAANRESRSVVAMVALLLVQGIKLL